MGEVLGLLMTGFWLLMLYDCIRNEPERQSWLWILIVVNFPAAVIYFFMRWIPRSNVSLPLPTFLTRWTRKQELWTAQVQAKNIGKAHQYVILGNLYYDMGIWDEAETAYKQALEKESDNIQALWGAASLAIKNKQFASAKEHLQVILKIDPDHKYGDASLLYGEMLFNLQELDAAKQHLEKHIKNWSHPNAYITLAKVLSQQGEKQAARDYLETMIVKIKSSSYYYYKNNRGYIGKAEKLLKTLKS